MEILKQALKEMKGENVDIHTRHRLFGEDNIKCKHFIPVIEKGAGFEFRDQVIYIPYDKINSYEVISYKTENCKIIINGNNHSIEVAKRA